ncbi:hypothetical protein BABINDRAFT_11320 [Babjeviella inositovora NRRL Y-12698]|uniref:XPA C-terminal domain-containing protein n=1 Tax=Babjeviella inositovora NRRL Y-12698 TaxID=984486 RepID=A0A1E3QZE9_9ASCO|nr:uncharacterized protein BABINDRAFT_11320 [Babjeviella inositovora NRRL Y-12698]ODQ82991.1 hypothetical protein BABINDRAFT_11320 [Babjeviella inositovora NRRL Y-12698]
MLRSALSSWREYLTPVSHTSTFQTSGEITPEEFVAAGDYLVYRFPTWQWSSAPENKRKDFLPADKQFLVTKHVPSYIRAATYLGAGIGDDEEEVEGEDGWTTTHMTQQTEAVVPQAEEAQDIDDLIDENAEDDEYAAVTPSTKDHRSYDLHIAYSTSYRVPKMYLLGYTAEGTPLTPEQMFEDISADYRDKTVTIEKAPFLNNTTLISIHPCRHATVMKVLMARAAAAKQNRDSKDIAEGIAKLGVNQDTEEEWESVDESVGEGIRVDQYLVIFLKFISTFIKGKLTPEQQRRIEANRRKALERLKQKGLAKAGDRIQTFEKSEGVSKPPVALTADQRNKIEANRRRALEILQYKQMNHRDASEQTGALTIPIVQIPASSSTSVRNGPSFTGSAAMVAEASVAAARPLSYIVPSVRKSDYIEYDFSTMKDTRGGFINDDATVEGERKTLEEWQKEQQVIKEPAPPIDLSSMPQCYECRSVNLDKQLYDVFKCRVCRVCKEKMPDKYTLLTKTEVKEDYFLTDPELNDTELFKRLEKANPYSGTFSRMQLFLRYEVEAYAFKKWGTSEALDAEWARREEMRVKRRDKKYELKLKEMRKKTRAEEYTRRFRESSRVHQHQWSEPVVLPGEDGMVKRRCLDCGMETEEFLIG